jgi:hypothetical protein
MGPRLAMATPGSVCSCILMAIALRNARAAGAVELAGASEHKIAETKHVT